MIISSVNHNNRRHVFELVVDGREHIFPYFKAYPVPTAADPVMASRVGQRGGRPGFKYRLASWTVGWVALAWVFEYELDPERKRDLLLCRLTAEAQERVDASAMAKREIARRLGTSPAQLYRLMDAANHGKSVDQLLMLLFILECDIDLTCH